MRRLVGDTSRSLATQGADSRSRVGPSGSDSAGADSASVQELYGRAQSVTNHIEELEREARRKELTRLLDATAQDPSAVVPRDADAGEVDAASVTPQALVGALDGLESRAEAALDRQRRLVARRRMGATVYASPGRSDDGSLARIVQHVAGVDFYRRDFVGTTPRPPYRSPSTRRGDGRVLGPGGPFAERIYLDSWYLLGPFENERRENIRTRFPPELGMDLDAEYVGKGGRLIRWSYVETSIYPFVPPEAEQYAVYYGYSEVKMDRARDLWVSFGSDDESKVWLNDEVVWVSGRGFKPWYRGGGYKSLPSYVAQWNLTETERRLHFRKGNNRILFRLENGYGLLFFSMVIEGRDPTQRPD